MCLFVHISDLEVQQALKQLQANVPDFMIKPIGHEHHLDKPKKIKRKIKESKRPFKKIIRTSIFHHLVRKAKKKNKKRHKKYSYETEKSF